MPTDLVSGGPKIFAMAMHILNFSYSDHDQPDWVILNVRLFEPPAPCIYNAALWRTRLSEAKKRPTGRHDGKGWSIEAGGLR